MNKLRIAGIVNDSVVDGPGLRFTLFTQGCPHNCYNCHNPRTHNEDGGYSVSICEILKTLDKNFLADGLTVSGGEPFLQYRPLTALLKDIKGRGLSVIVYTGYTWEELTKDFNKYEDFLNEIDILIDGRYEDKLRSYRLKYIGSENQRIIDVNATLRNGGIVLKEL